MQDSELGNLGLIPGGDKLVVVLWVSKGKAATDGKEISTTVTKLAYWKVADQKPVTPLRPSPGKELPIF